MGKEPHQLKYRNLTAKQWHDSAMETELMCRKLRERLEPFDPQFVLLSRAYPLEFLDHIEKFNDWMDEND